MLRTDTRPQNGHVDHSIEGRKNSSSDIRKHGKTCDKGGHFLGCSIQHHVVGASVDRNGSDYLRVHTTEEEQHKRDQQQANRSQLIDRMKLE